MGRSGQHSKSGQKMSTPVPVFRAAGLIGFLAVGRKNRGDFANEILSAHLKCSAQHQCGTLGSLAYQRVSVHGIYKHKHEVLPQPSKVVAH